MYRDQKYIYLVCLSPRVSFVSIKKENPRNIIFTSGTLPDKKTYEDLTSLKFQDALNFKLKN